VNAADQGNGMGGRGELKQQKFFQNGRFSGQQKGTSGFILAEIGKQTALQT